ncbi:MAG: hypothetical protein ACRELF_16290 [Gemmataceae bacterium]
MANFQDVSVKEMQQVEGGNWLGDAASFVVGYAATHPAEVSYAIDVLSILL